ncbi:MAG: DegT/DnrJ/EryC1/StrS family aminotransferase [Nitrospirae bacterium]|nr:DegT/DnrJ/EryC1/StrS family aminotransferase [Nitrospirota bacterium]MCL5978081.1 DegT/DnrJ/EryC1/StrS family aminotransferase [Nitrospirota bacterium]
MKQIQMLDLKAEYEYMKDSIDAAIKKCLAHQKWIFGPEIAELEDTVTKYLNAKYCIGVSSGTEALVLSLRALAIETKGEEFFNKEDKIITTPFTFTATGNAIARSGATPVFVDIDPETYNIDSKKIKEYLTSAENVIGIIPVHLYGQPCNMDEIMGIAAEYNLFVIEDTAQAFGGEWSGSKLGSIGTTGAFSFFPSKNLGGFGDGGMLSTNDPEINEIVRMLIRQGGKDKYNVMHVGYNARLDTMQAAIVLAKMKYINEFIERRRKIAEVYNKDLEGIEGLSLPKIPSAASKHSYNQYTVRVDVEKRDLLQKFLNEKGISTMIYYPLPLHKMASFERIMEISGSLEVSEMMSQEVLSLPMSPLQKEEDTYYVTETIKEFFSRNT